MNEKVKLLITGVAMLVVLTGVSFAIGFACGKAYVRNQMRTGIQEIQQQLADDLKAIAPGLSER